MRVWGVLNIHLPDQHVQMMSRSNLNAHLDNFDKNNNRTILINFVRQKHAQFIRKKHFNKIKTYLE